MALKIAGMSEYFGKRIHLENLNSNRHENGVTIVLLDDSGETLLQEQQPAVYNTRESNNTSKAIEHHPLLPSPVSRNVLLPSSSDLSAQLLASAAIPSGSDLPVKLEPDIHCDLAESTNKNAPSSYQGNEDKPSTVNLDFKEDLKKKIMERRRAEGKQMIDLAKEEEMRKLQQEQEHLTQEDIERRMKKRQQNNQAAKRCRENRKQQEIKMEKEMDIQVKRRRQLQQAMEELQREKEMIQRIWKESSTGTISADTKRKIESMKKTDYEKFIPKPLPTRQISVESDTEKSVSDKDTELSGIPLKSVQAANDTSKQGKSSLEGYEVSHVALFSEMFQEMSRRREVHSEESTSSCMSAEEDAPSGSVRNEHLGQNKPTFIDLTDDSDSSIGDVPLIKASAETYRAGITAKHTLLELAEATYTEMTKSEELGYQMSQPEQMNDAKKDEDADSEIDEEDFLPLVIDLAK